MIYDCIEFSRRLRCADVACDLAFLTMDLDLSGYRGFSRYLVRRYVEEAEDPDLERLIGLYSTDRALVRGKVACLRAAELPFDDPRHVTQRRASARHRTRRHRVAKRNGGADVGFLHAVAHDDGLPGR